MTVKARFKIAKAKVSGWHLDLFSHMETCNLSTLSFSSFPESFKLAYAEADEDTMCLMAATIVMSALMRTEGDEVNHFDRAIIERATACMVVAIGVSSVQESIGLMSRANPFTEALMEGGIVIQ